MGRVGNFKQIGLKCVYSQSESFSLLMIVIAKYQCNEQQYTVLSAYKEITLQHIIFQEKCHQYWPSERSARYQYFVVDPMAEYNMPQYILREFKVTDARVSCVSIYRKIQ